MSAPRLSVIVPAYQGERVLPRALAALAASDLPRTEWELIVVNDASTDGTAAVAAQFADRVVSLSGRPHGPGFARNRGVEVSRGTWVVFVDADVVVHPETLRAFTAVIDAHPDVAAIFGAYDEHPPAPNFLSQYRNLLHRYVHLRGAGDADTFWAGCGAVRRAAFQAVGGFDERRYPRPQIEDIELGYRLRDHGYRIVLRPEIEGAHLKHWRFWGSTRTDLLDRGVPWVRLLLERGRLGRASNLNLQRGERAKTAVVGLALIAVAGGVVIGRWELAGGGGVALLGVALTNWPILRWFRERRGVLFALRVIPMNIWYYVVSGSAVAVALVSRGTSSAPVATQAPSGASER